MGHLVIIRNGFEILTVCHTNGPHNTRMSLLSFFRSICVSVLATPVGDIRHRVFPTGTKLNNMLVTEQHKKSLKSQKMHKLQPRCCVFLPERTVRDEFVCVGRLRDEFIS